MKLIEALQLARLGAGREGVVEYRLFLGCSFSPLHLETFVAAYLSHSLPARKVVLTHGRFGDLVASLRLAAEQGEQNVAVFLEWFDFDPRLSIRSLGGWADLDQIIADSDLASERIKSALGQLKASQVLVSLPGLPLPPVFRAQSQLLSGAEARLRRIVWDLAQWAATQAHLQVVNPYAIDALSPPLQRWDIKTDISAGFPYTLTHTDVLAGTCVKVLVPPVRLKGIITDLDDTLWNGVVGEVGPGNVTWSLEHGSQPHGLYQQTLAALAENGVLVAVASKNDRNVMANVLDRTDLMIPGSSLFPIDLHWGPKSESVARILRAWNVGPESVAFIDDSPLEIAEVQSVFPEIECRLFPKENPAGVMALLRWLRDAFARESVTDEDKLRRQSLEQKLTFDKEARHTDTEAFLQSLQAEVTFQQSDRKHARAFELVNKTNQFNINGSRYTLDQWQARGQRSGDFVFTVSYQDRFGPLGTIAVMAGRVCSCDLHLEDWVISCRAFSRRIEFRCLACLFAVLEKDRVRIDFRPTPRNSPAQELLRDFFSRIPAEAVSLVLSRDDFEKRCPKLYDQSRHAN